MLQKLIFVCRNYFRLILKFNLITTQKQNFHERSYEFLVFQLPQTFEIHKNLNFIILEITILLQLFAEEFVYF